MEILIVGKSGYGKSRVDDALRNFIFKKDKDCTITTDDPDRETKILGKGKNIYNLHVSQIVPETLDSYDVIVEIRSKALSTLLDLLE